MTSHWTDHAAEPIFTTVLRARGSRANIFVILGAACSMLRQLNIPKDRIDRLCNDVTNAANYDQAVALIEHWFSIDRSR